MRTLERFKNLGETVEGTLFRRSSLTLVLTGAIAGSSLAACKPSPLPEDCQENYDDCNESYLNCLYDTPAPEQETNCEPIKDFCDEQAMVCSNENDSATASGSGNSSYPDITGSTGSTGAEETTGDIEGTTTSGGEGGGGSSSGMETTGAEETETGEDMCPEPDCGPLGCEVGEPGSDCQFLGDVIYDGITDCDGECHFNYSCDPSCVDGTNSIANFNCDTFPWQVDLCDGES